MMVSLGGCGSDLVGFFFFFFFSLIWVFGSGGILVGMVAW